MTAEPTRVVNLTLVPKPPPPFSEEALALRFAERHKDDLRYVAQTGQWFEWDGTRWKRDSTLRAFDLARALCRDASAECNETARGKAIASKHTVYAVETLARADRRLVAETDQWDRDPRLLNTPRGTIDLRTGEMREHRLDDYCTRVTPVSPSPALAEGVASGELTPAEAAELAKVIESYRLAVETADIERRLAALEEARERRR
jgi:phage/plasmid-associated DNA primase